MMATTIMSSMSVKPRWLPGTFFLLCQNFIIIAFPPLRWASKARKKMTIL